jgi:hypothetical protein
VAPCDGFDGAFLDGAMHQVDRCIGGKEPASTLAIASGQSLDAPRDLVFGQAAHFRSNTDKFLKVGLESFQPLFSQNHDSTQLLPPGMMNR